MVYCGAFLERAPRVRIIEYYSLYGDPLLTRTFKQQAELLLLVRQYEGAPAISMAIAWGFCEFKP